MYGIDGDCIRCDSSFLVRLSLSTVTADPPLQGVRRIRLVSSEEDEEVEDDEYRFRHLVPKTFGLGSSQHNDAHGIGLRGRAKYNPTFQVNLVNFTF